MNTIKKTMKSNKGITVMSLVITIIVLLILVGVSISMLSGDNSTIGNAQKAKIENEKAQVKEELALSWHSVQIKSLTKRWKNETTRDALLEELKKEDSSATVTLEEQLLKVKYKGYETTINIDNDNIAALVKVDAGSSSGNNENPPSSGGGNEENPPSTQVGINWEEIMRTAVKHPDQTGSNDIGIDAKGNIVNLDLWVYHNMGEKIEIVNLVENCTYDTAFLPFTERYDPSGCYEQYIAERNNIVCPEYIKIDGNNKFYPVTSIGYYAFNGASSADLESIVLPSTLKIIEKGAFYDCSNLGDITIPKNVETVMEFAFDGNVFLRNLYIDSQTILNNVNNVDRMFGINLENIYVKEDIYNNSLNVIRAGNGDYIFDSIENGYAKFVLGEYVPDVGSELGSEIGSEVGSEYGCN